MRNTAWNVYLNNMIKAVKYEVHRFTGPDHTIKRGNLENISDWYPPSAWQNRPVSAIELMGEARYNEVLSRQWINNFADTYGDADAKVLIIVLDESEVF